MNDVIDLTDDEDEEGAKASRGSSSLGEDQRKKRATAVVDLTSDEGELSTPQSRPATLPPSSPTSGADDNIDDMDIDALLAAEAEARKALASSDAFLEVRAPVITEDDEAMWEAIDTGPVSMPAPKKPTSQLDFDDEDMWDIVRETEQDVGKSKLPAIRESLSAEARRKDEEEWESMYS